MSELGGGKKGGALSQNRGGFSTQNYHGTASIQRVSNQLPPPFFNLTISSILLISSISSNSSHRDTELEGTLQAVRVILEQQDGLIILQVSAEPLLT